MNKVFFYASLKYFIFFVLFYVLQNASIQGLHPFAFGMLFALVWCNQKIYILAPLYILAGFLTFFDVTHLIIDLICAGVLLLACLMHYRFKKPFKPVILGMYAFLSQFGMLYFAFTTTDGIWGGIVTLLIGMTAMYAYIHILQNLILRGVRRKLLIDEILCAGVLVFAVGVGLYSVPLGEYIYFGVLALLVLMSAYVFSTTFTLVFALMLGLGAAFAAEELLLISHAILLGLVAVATKCSKRVYMSIALILVDIIVGLYFMPVYTLFNLLATMIGALLFLLIPTKFYDKMISFTIDDNEDVAVRSIVNRNRKALCGRLYNLSEAFFEMKNVFISMVQHRGNFNDSLDYFAQDIKRQMCLNCSNKTECLRIQAEETDRAIKEMLQFAYDRGKVSLLDVPANLCAHCIKLNALIAAINTISDEYKQKLQVQNNLDSGRLLLGEQMYGISQIMHSLATEVSLNVSFDSGLENKIIEGLMYEGVVCSEAVVYRKNEKLYSATLVVQKKNIDKSKIIKVLTQVFGMPMSITNITDGEKAGFNIVSMCTANRFDIVFGSAGAVKADSKVSGDTHTVIKLDNNKILLALCDGMGSGEQAERTSSLALGLIENFYKAGFENSLILSSVNKLLEFGGEESFSALDASVLDLNDGTCDMIKLGSPVTYIKLKDEVKRLDAGALPLGILDDIRPNIRSFTLNDGDMIVLMTDGITDSFTNIDELDTLIKESTTTNPQILANEILNKALANYKNLPADDMTVLIGRIYTKI